MKEVKSLKNEVAYLRKECFGCKRKLEELEIVEPPEEEPLEEEPPAFYLTTEPENCMYNLRY